MKATTGKDIGEHIIRLVKVIPASLILATNTPLLIWIHTLWREPMKITELWMRRPVGKRLIVVLM
jgi:hypothetical protein